MARIGGPVVISVLCAALALGVASAAAGRKQPGQLTDHGGPVLIQTKAFAIYLRPQGADLSDAYVDGVNGFLTNLYDSGPSGGMGGSLYSLLFEYVRDDVSGTPSGGRSFGWYSFLPQFNAATDSDPLPAGSCKDGHATVCLDGAELRAAIETTRERQGWATTWTSNELPSLTGDFAAPPFFDSCSCRGAWVTARRTAETVRAPSAARADSTASTTTRARRSCTRSFRTTPACVAAIPASIRTETMPTPSPP